MKKKYPKTSFDACKSMKIQHTREEIEDMMGSLLCTVENLREFLPTMNDEQINEAYDAVTEAENSLDDIVFNLDDK